MNRDHDTGSRLREVRESAGLSQRELAKKANVTNSTISLIEANKTNPSVGALKRILDEVPVSLAEFFSANAKTRERFFFRSDQLKQIGKGGISYRQVGPHHVGKRLQILHECYQPRSDTGRVSLTHDGEEGGIVLSGRLEVTVDGQACVLGPGDAYYFSSRLPHRFRCIGRDPAWVVSACSPPTF